MHNVRLVEHLAENDGSTRQSWKSWVTRRDVLVDGVLVGTLQEVGFGYWGFAGVDGVVRRVDAHIYNWWKPLRALLELVGWADRPPVTAEDWYWGLALRHHHNNAPLIEWDGSTATRWLKEWAGRQPRAVPPDSRALVAETSAQSLPEELRAQYTLERLESLEREACVRAFIDSQMYDEVFRRFAGQNLPIETRQIGSATAYADNSEEITLERADGRRIRKMTVGPSGDRCF